MQIELKGLSKNYNDAGRNLTVIAGLNHVFTEKKSVAILGKSGVGKSTLLHLLAGIDQPNSGTISYGAAVITTFSQNQLAEFRLKNIGFLFQFHNLLPEFTALENVALPLILRGTGEAVAGKQAAALLGRVGLAERSGHKPAELSGGERQRVAVARAFINQPTVVLADEPTGSLDPQTAAATGELILQLARDQGISLLAVTHNTDFAALFDIQLEMQPGGNLNEIKISK